MSVKFSSLTLLCTQFYVGRSINKLQNSAILLVCEILKIRKIRFIGNLILIAAVSFMAMTSL